MNKPTGKLAFAYQSIANLESKLSELRAENEALKGQLSSHQKLAAKGIYYTNEELLQARRNFVLHDLTNPTKEVEGWLNKIRAQAVRECSAALEIDTLRNGSDAMYMCDYADKIERGEA